MDPCLAEDAEVSQMKEATMATERTNRRTCVAGSSGSLRVSGRIAYQLLVVVFSFSLSRFRILECINVCKVDRQPRRRPDFMAHFVEGD